jgi:uncharacterized protein YbjT (DUF2867 family)
MTIQTSNLNKNDFAQSKTALILGATGRIRHEVAAALNRHGWQIKALHRDPAKAAGRGNAG